jgi:hypothetical protein
MAMRHRQDVIDGVKYSIYIWDESCRICKHYYSSIILKWLVIQLLNPFIKVASDFSLYVGSSLSVPALMHLYWFRLLDDSRVNRQCLGWLLSLIIFLAFRDIWCCRCPGGQVVYPRWCVVKTVLPSGEPCGWGWCCTKRWYSPTGCSRLCICRSLWGL